MAKEGMRKADPGIEPVMRVMRCRRLCGDDGRYCSRRVIDGMEAVPGAQKITASDHLPRQFGYATLAFVHRAEVLLSCRSITLKKYQNIMENVLNK